MRKPNNRFKNGQKVSNWKLVASTLPHFGVGAALVAFSGVKWLVFVPLLTSTFHLTWILGYHEQFGRTNDIKIM